MKKGLVGGLTTFFIIAILLIAPISTAPHKTMKNSGQTVNDMLDCYNVPDKYFVPIANGSIEDASDCSNGNDELDQEQTKTGGGCCLCGRWMWAQSFVPTMPILTRVELLIYWHGTVNDIKVSIRKYLYGEDLTYIVKKPKEIPHRWAEWTEFDFPDINVIPNEIYYIVISTTGGDCRENWYIIESSKGDVYPYGDGYMGYKETGNYYHWTLWNSSKSGKFDFCFKTYGIKTEYHEKERQKWTLMIYDDADYPQLYDPFDDYLVETYSGRGLNVVILQDTYGQGAKMWYVDTYHHKKLLKDMGEIDMGDPTTLYEFIRYCKQRYKTDRYILEMYNHGGGWFGSCWDKSNGDDFLSMEELRKALQDAGGVDILMFSGACLMATIECAYEVRDVTDVYIASEELNGYKVGLFSPLCEILNHDYNYMDSKEVGKEIIKYMNNSWAFGWEFVTLSAVRTDKMEELSKAVSKLAKDLTIRWFSNYQKVRKAYGETAYFGKSYANSYQLYDLYGFCKNLLEIGVKEKIKNDVEKVIQILNETIIANYHSRWEPNAYGLSIYFPDVFMNGVTIMYGDSSYGLDFPEDTFWNEFLGLYVISATLFP